MKTNLAEEQLKKSRENAKGFASFSLDKTITEETPFIYLSTIINEELLKKHKDGGGFLAAAIHLFNTDKKAFTVLLEQAGYKVEGLRSTI